MAVKLPLVLATVGKIGCAEELQPGDVVRGGEMFGHVQIFDAMDSTRNQTSSAWLAVGFTRVYRGSFSGGFVAKFRARAYRTGSTGLVRLYEVNYAATLGTISVTGTSFGWYEIDVTSTMPATGLLQLEVQIAAANGSSSIRLNEAHLEIYRQ